MSQLHHARATIKDLLAERGMNGTELGRATGVSQSTITRFLAGETANLTYETLAKIAHHFHLNVSELTGETRTLSDPAEQEMVWHFRGMNDQAREAIMAAARVLHGKYIGATGDAPAAPSSKRKPGTTEHSEAA